MYAGAQHTCDNLWTLKVLVRVDIAGGQSQVEAQDDQKEICSSPHNFGSLRESHQKQMITGRDKHILPSRSQTCHGLISDRRP